MASNGFSNRGEIMYPCIKKAKIYPVVGECAMFNKVLLPSYPVFRFHRHLLEEKNALIHLIP